MIKHPNYLLANFYTYFISLRSEANIKILIFQFDLANFAFDLVVKVPNRLFSHASIPNFSFFSGGGRGGGGGGGVGKAFYPLTLGCNQ